MANYAGFETNALIPWRQRMAMQHAAAEPQALQPLLAEARLTPPARARVLAHADHLVAAIRTSTDSGLEAFLQEYRLSSTEGLALLRLAESLLRVPDAATAKALLHDKLSAGDWQAHAGASSSRFVNLATRGLVLSQNLVKTVEHGPVALAHLLKIGGEPLLQRAMSAAMKLMGGHFVMGCTIEEAIAGMDRRFRYSFDMLGEAAMTGTDAARYRAAYRDTIQYLATRHTPADANTLEISIKLSALHPRYEEEQRDRVLCELSETFLELTVAACDAGIGVTVDAEEAERLDLSLDVMAKVLSSSELRGYEQFGFAVQAYQKRARPLIDWAEALAERLDRRLHIRLVKGAYWDTEIKRAQERGLDGYPVFTRKAATDVSYLACARALLDAHGIFPAFATHNALTVATILEWAGPRRDFEFQRLFGMGGGLYEALMAEDGPPCRIYAPVGAHRDLLAYLARRLLENGANTSFINQVNGPTAPSEDLLADPAEHLEAVRCTPHPRIPLPRDLFGERRNSRGIDLKDRRVIAEIGAGIARAAAETHSACPLVDGRDVGGIARPIADPADRRRIVGTVVEATAAEVERALAMAFRSIESWTAQSIEDRAVYLDRAADLLEGDRETLWALAIREGGKTIPDAIGEVREAVDFCRFYAQEARRRLGPLALPGPTGEDNRLSYSGRGVFACISPWNFPLAIFIGQVTAALVAGDRKSVV